MFIAEGIKWLKNYLNLILSSSICILVKTISMFYLQKKTLHEVDLKNKALWRQIVV
jgi:hypothetical protein